MSLKQRLEIHAEGFEFERYAIAADIRTALALLERAADEVAHVQYSESVPVEGVGFETNVYCFPDCLRCELDRELGTSEPQGVV